MSRSRKKTPCVGYTRTDGHYKGLFNKRVRHAALDEDLDGGAYRKRNESWEIADGKCRMSWEQARVRGWTREEWERMFRHK